MTVTDIQEYARKEMRHIRTGIKDEFKEEHYNALIYKICELLDGLDNRPRAKWVKQDYSTGYSEYGTASICSKCGSEVISKTNYCSNCGAIMNEELGQEENLGLWEVEDDFYGNRD